MNVSRTVILQTRLKQHRIEGLTAMLVKRSVSQLISSADSSVDFKPVVMNLRKVEVDHASS